MKEEEIEEALEQIRGAILHRLNADNCKRCKKQMPVTITGVYFVRQMQPDHPTPNAVWQAVWTPAESGWATVEIGSNRFCLCPSCAKEVLPFPGL
jgi:hypothetical protein